MKTNTDIHYIIGEAHLENQDYCTHNGLHDNSILNSGNLIVLSDGCSSSPKTDMGARILTQEAIVCCPTAPQLFFKHYPHDILQWARKTCKKLDLPQNCLDATLNIAKVYENNLNVLMIGDGLFFQIYNDGSLHLAVLSYPSDAPYYLNYRQNKDRRDSFIKQFGLKRKIRDVLIDSKGLITYDIETETSEDDWYSNSIPITCQKAVGFVSDGGLSFYEELFDSDGYRKGTKLVEHISGLRELLSFKSFQGEFVQRRMKAFTDQNRKRHWKHSDDLSMAAIYFNNDE